MYLFSAVPILIILGFLGLLLFIFQRFFSGAQVPQKVEAGAEGVSTEKCSDDGTEEPPTEELCMASASKGDAQQETTTRRRMSAGSQKGAPLGAARKGPMRSS